MPHHGCRPLRSPPPTAPSAPPWWWPTWRIWWAVQVGCLGFHPWPYRADRPEITDELRIDLDPSPGVSFDQVREAALETRALLSEWGIASFAKTSGSKGLHVYVALEPRWDSYDVRRAAVSVARALEQRRPDLITAQWWKEERGTRVFVDFNQNAPTRRCSEPGAYGPGSAARCRARSPGTR